MEKFDFAYLNLIFGGLGILCLMIPAMIHRGQNEISPYSERYQQSEVESIEFKISGVALLISSCPALLDSLISLFAGGLSGKDKKCLIGRLFLSSVTTLAGLMYALQRDYLGLFHDYLSSYWFAMWSLRFAWASSLMYFLTVLKPSLFTIRESTAMTVFFCLFSAVRFNSLQFGYHVTARLALSIVEYGMPLLTIIILWRGSKLWSLRKKWTVDDYSCLLYWILLIYTMSVSSIRALYYRLSIELANYVRPNDILFFVDAITVSNIMMSVIPGQISKYNEVASKDHIIATKQAYVRYISHELRTPMNIIQNGLQFCISKIPENTSKTIEKITRKTLIETDLASRVALEILNDLLLYDKLESGLVEIKKEVVGVLEFVSQCTKTFSVQLRAKSLHFKCSNKDKDISSNQNTISTKDIRQITHHDKVEIDKSKMSQVVRNIMSNAIKFTPEKGFY